MSTLQSRMMQRRAERPTTKQRRARKPHPRAAMLNRRFASKLRWAPMAGRIRTVIGAPSPSWRDFVTAMQLWQQSQGLTPDGVLGPEDWKTMQPVLDAPEPPPTPPVVAPAEEPAADEPEPDAVEGEHGFRRRKKKAACGCSQMDRELEGPDPVVDYPVNRKSKEYIRWYQTALNWLNGAGLEVDGIAGSKTKAAVRVYQAKRGLKKDGIVGANTEQSLLLDGAGYPPKASSTAPSTGSDSAVQTPLPRGGVGFYTDRSQSRQYGTREGIDAILATAQKWAQAHPSGPKIGIGDISKQGGGYFPPHASHQHGLDADIRLMRNDGKQAGTRYQDSTYSRQLTQELVNTFRANGVLKVQYIFFNDPAVSGVKPWPGHDDHLHVRFYPPGADKEYEEVFGSRPGCGCRKCRMARMHGADCGCRECNEEAEGESFLEDIWNWYNPPAPTKPPAPPSPPSAPKPSNRTVNYPVDRDSKEYVRWYQTELNRILPWNLVVDGIFGPKTEGAVIEFQRRKKLLVDGIVGPQTEGALLAAGAKMPPASGGGGGTSPAPSTPVPGERSCPAPGDSASGCLSPQRCSPIPDLLCLSSVSSVPIDDLYDWDTTKKPMGGKSRPGTFKMRPSVRTAIATFLTEASKAGLPIDRILSQGAYLCRCQHNTSKLSNHGRGEAIDVGGVKLKSPAGREVVVPNFRDPAERLLLRRINAALRMGFATVLDYNYNSDHENHFHCEVSAGTRQAKAESTVKFVQEALSFVLGRTIPITGEYNSATEQGLRDFGATQAEMSSDSGLNKVYDRLFRKVAAGVK